MNCNNIPENIYREIKKRIRSRAERNYLDIDYYTDSKNFGMWYHFSGRHLGKTWVLSNDTILRWLKNGSEFCYICRNKERAKRFWHKELDGTGLLLKCFVTTGEIHIAINPQEYNFGIEVETKTKDLETGETSVDVSYKPQWFKIGVIKSFGDIRSTGDWTKTNRVIFEEALCENYQDYTYKEFQTLESMLETIRPNKEYAPVQMIALGNLTSFNNPYFAQFGITPDEIKMGKRKRIMRDKTGYHMKNVLFDFRVCEGYIDRMMNKYAAKSVEDLTPYERYAIYGELIESEKEHIVQKAKGLPQWGFMCDGGDITLYFDGNLYYIANTKGKLSTATDGNRSKSYLDFEKLWHNGKISDFSILSSKYYMKHAWKLEGLISAYANQKIRFVGYDSYSIFKALIKDK